MSLILTFIEDILCFRMYFWHIQICPEIDATLFPLL